MTYQRSAPLKYRLKKKTTSGRARTFHWDRWDRSRKKTAHGKKWLSSRRAYAKIMDISRFLSTYLSGKRNVTLRTKQHPNTVPTVGPIDISGRTFFQITLPDWRTYDLKVDDYSKYRIYRNGLWHEASHIRFTPLNTYSYQSTDRLRHDLMNIIEDRRIEDLGVEEFPGYIPERLFSNAYAYSLRPSPADLYQTDPTLLSGRYEAFLQRLLVGKMKDVDKYPSGEKALIEKAAKHVEDKLKNICKFAKNESMKDTVFGALTNLVEDVVTMLGLQNFKPSRVADEFGVTPQPGQSSWDDTFSEGYSKKSGKSGKEIKDGIDEYLDYEEKKVKKSERKDGDKIKEPTKEEIEEARKGTEQSRHEYDQATKEGKEDEIPELRLLLPVASAVPPEMFRDDKFIREMWSRLRFWRKGKKDVWEQWGSFLSVPAYASGLDKPFLHRKKMKPKGESMLFILDFSGSQAYREADYKRALVSMFEVLDSIKTKLAVFGFGSEPDGSDIFFRLKTFEEPRWKPRHSAKLAALSAGFGWTPTGDIYYMLRDYIRKHRPKYTVTVTDGQPNKGRPTGPEVKILRQYTKMIAWGLDISPDTLKRFGYNHSFATDDVYEIPKHMVKLVIPES